MFFYFLVGERVDLEIDYKWDVCEVCLLVYRVLCMYFCYRYGDYYKLVIVLGIGESIYKNKYEICYILVEGIY